MSTPAVDEDARRRALDIVDTLMAEARAGRMPDLPGALERLRAVDPALQRRIAEAMLRSRGDLGALRAVLEEAPSLTTPKPASRLHATARPPTVVDGRGRPTWPVLLLATVAALAAAALIALAGQ